MTNTVRYAGEEVDVGGKLEEEGVTSTMTKLAISDKQGPLPQLHATQLTSYSNAGAPSEYQTSSSKWWKEWDIYPLCQMNMTQDCPLQDDQLNSTLAVYKSIDIIISPSSSGGSVCRKPSFR